MIHDVTPYTPGTFHRWLPPPPTLPTMRRRLTLVILPTLLAGCDILGLSDTRRETWEVAPYKRQCMGLFPTLCIQVRGLGDDAFGNRFSRPDGFSFEWGVRSVIDVEIRTIENPPADGSSLEVTLRSVLAESLVEPGFQFTIRVPTDPGLVEVGPDVWRVFHEDPLLMCGAPVDCEAFRQDVLAHPGLEITLTIPSAPADSFVLGSWTPCDTPGGICAAPL